MRSNCNANGAQGLVFSEPSQTVNGAGPYVTHNTTNAVSASGQVYFRVTFTSTNPAQVGRNSVCVENINATAHMYEGIPGLIRKYYGIAPDGASLVGIYLWDSKAAADAFYTPEWLAMVTKRWASPPQRQEWETPMVVESAERRLVAAE